MKTQTVMPVVFRTPSTNARGHDLPLRQIGVMRYPRVRKAQDLGCAEGFAFWKCIVTSLFQK